MKTLDENRYQDTKDIHSRYQDTLVHTKMKMMSFFSFSSFKDSIEPA